MVIDYARKSGYDDSDDFDFGLDLILDGLARVLESITAPEDRAL